MSAGADRILTINPGSSSVKLSVIETDAGEMRLVEQRSSAGSDDQALAEHVRAAGALTAVAVRVVHGGSEFHQATWVDDDILARLDRTSTLAPLHNPPALRALRTVRALQPSVRLAACFDTAFHADLPVEARTYALPQEWRRRWDLRRFGFHGLSHAYASRRAAEMTGLALDDARIVVCHLGSGASLAAVKAGRSIDTTMGFTPLDGLVMATRAGSIDPGIVLWVLRQALSVDDVEDALEHRSGLRGLAGSDDLRAIEAAAARGDPVAECALAVMTHRLRAAMAGMVAALGGVDIVVFTGGVGEHSARVRADACSGLEHVGVAIDPSRNQCAQGDDEISSPNARVRTVVVEAREDLEMCRQVEILLTLS